MTMEDLLDAVVVGGAGVDTNVYLLGDDIDWSVESNFTRNVDCVGQAGGYSSRLFARHTCTLVAGDDGFLTRHELDERFAALRG